MALRDFYAAQDQKAIPYRPQLTNAGGPYTYGGGYGDTNPYNPNSYSVPRLRTPISQREAFRHMQAYGGDEAIDHLMNAVNFTVEACASADWHFENSEGVSLAAEKKPSDPADLKLAPPLLVKLIEEPNPYQGWEEFFELTLIDWLIVGNSYWVKWQVPASGQPLALYRMAPHCVRVVPGQFGVEKYLYKLPGSRDEVEFLPEQVLHFKRANPHSPYLGLGIVQGGARALDMEIELTNTMANYYGRQALPSGVVQTERRVPKDVFAKLKAQLRSFYSGSSNAGQLMVLEAGLKYQTISPTAGDALFAEMGHWSRDRIYAMLHLNPGLLGIWDGTGDPKLADWQRLFDNKTAKPLLNKFGRAISSGLTQPGWGLDMVFDYEEVQQPDDVLKRAQTIAALPGVKVHEVRNAANLPPSTGDTKIDNEVLNMPGPELGPTGKGGFPDAKMAGQPGRPPLPQNTKTFKGVAKPGVKPGGSASRQGKAMKMSPQEALRALDDIKAMKPANVHIGEIAGVEAPVDSIGNARTLEIDSIVADVQRELADAATTLERGLLDATEGKANQTPYQRVKASKAWSTFRDKVGAILEAAAQRGLSLANIQHAKTGLNPDFENDYESLAKELVYRPDGVRGIVNTFKASVLAKIGKEQRLAESDVQKTIQTAISEWQAGTSKTVALTEATRAYNEGTVQIAESNGLTHVYVSDGNDHDEPCKAADGQTWTLAQARKSPIEHPNCRRAFLPVTIPA